MDFISRIPSTIGIRPGESRLVNLLLLHSFLVGINKVLLLSVSTALFLTEFGANTLPYIYIATAVGNGSVGFIYNWLGRRISFVNLLIANLIFQFVLVAGFWILFGLTNAQWPIIAFMIAFELLWLLTNLEFWSLSARVFNIQQGKRLFGVIGSGDTIASIIGGFSVPLIVSWIGTRNLLLPACASILGSLAIILLINRLFRDRLLTQHEELSTDDAAAPPVPTSKNRYILLIFAFACLATISYYFLDNAFYSFTEFQFPGNDSLTSFLGIYFAFVALAQLIVQTFFSARIINRLGIATCIILVPVLGTLMLGATAVVAIVAGTATITFIFIAATRLGEYVVRGTITYSAQMTLYQSLPPAARLQTEAQVESFIEPITTGLTGILLLVVLDVLKWNAVHLIYLSMLIGLIWTVSAVFLGREYPKALLQALSKRRLGQNPLYGKDYSISALLKTSLTDRNAHDVLYLINLAAETDTVTLQQALPHILSHPSPEVRLDVLSRIEQLKLVSARPAMRSLLDTETDLNIRATAIRVASIIDPDFMSNQTVHYMASDALPIQLAAITGVLRSGTPKAITMAEAHLQQLLVSKSPRDRTLAVQAVGEMGIQRMVPHLLMLLQDENMDVRRATCIAAGKLKNSQLWPAIIENLSVNAVRSTAVAVLSSGDDSLRPFLVDKLSEVRAGFESGTARRRNFAAQLIHVASRLPDTALLESHIDFPDPSVRGQVLNTLMKMKFHPSDPERIEARIRTEIQADLLYLQGLVLLNDDPFLPHILRYLLDRLRERVFQLCALNYDPAAVERIRADYHSDSEAKQSYALEMLHVTLSHELRLLVISLLDNDLEYHQGLDALVAILEQDTLNRDQWLERVLTSVNSPSWLKVITLYGIRSRGAGEVPQAVQTAAHDTNAIVRETAIWALNNPAESAQTRGKMLMSIEKILLLKSVDLFSHVSDPILFEIASIVKDETVPEGKTIIRKGDLGDFMYIIASGRVRIHDGDQTITYLGENDEFGELALLDSEPRSASVTAVEETYLLRLDQNTFYELISDYPDVLRGIIQVLSGRLRDTTRRVTMSGAALPAAQVEDHSLR